jgi:NAD(P)-dependent dehydrogenase (short-subunit alcohol dehydrogenase family)
VTGASKNIGRGIALEVGAAGATVYLTARTLDATPGTLGSLRQTAADIEAAGGNAIPLQCDHGDDGSVGAVFEEIEARNGKLDLVVNVASPDFSTMVGRPFWELPLEDMTRCLWIGPRSNYVTTVLASRMMIKKGSGLIVNVSSHGSNEYLLSVPYGAGKAAIDKVTRDTALELRDHGVAVVSLWPGLVLTEGLLSRATPGDDGRLKLAGLDISLGESPKFNGKAVVALATDGDIMQRTGGSFRSSRLAREYGFTEDDGSLPPEVMNLAAQLGDEEIPDYWKGVERFSGQQPATPSGR